MIVKTAQGRFRVRVKDRGVVVADRTFGRWNDAQAWEADRKRHVAAGRLAPASARSRWTSASMPCGRHG